ncbi:HBL/NHE enterotoxin family protein [Bacillus cereus]|uniref:non-hemolytic enterotoxin subunit A n=1 Tax=Bacillus cereus TaxID=1396 RepID=UPI000C2847E2|nr:HBL/NHE enterotoxin family protein [Bacillus cereus]
MRKKIITGILITVISTSTPTYVTAFELERAESNPTKIAMIPNTVSNSIRLLGSQYPLIQAYGLVILQQPDVKIEAMSSLTNHQKFARENVREWMDEYTPKLIYLNQDIMRFSIRFNSYYSRLYDLAEHVDGNEQIKADFMRAFSKLQAHGKTVQENMEQTLSELNQFNTLLIKDSENLSKRAEVAIQSLKGVKGDIVQLRTEIKKIQEEIQIEISQILNRPKEIIRGSINIGKKIFAISSAASQNKTLDFVSIGSLSEELINTSDSQVRESTAIIQQKQKELNPLIQKLLESQIQATEITVIEDQVKGFRELIKRQINTLEYLVNDWKGFNETMNQVEIDFNTGVIDGELLQKQLIRFKKINDETRKQTKQFENYVTNISVT